jgi:hypothetical protein
VYGYRLVYVINAEHLCYVSVYNVAVEAGIWMRSDEEIITIL